MKTQMMAVLMLIAWNIPADAMIPRTVFPKPARGTVRECDRWEMMVVKFQEGSGIRRVDGAWVSTKVDVSPLDKIMTDYPGLQASRLFHRSEEEYIYEKQEGEKRTGRELADLNLYFAFRPPCHEAAESLLNDLLKLELVETAYAEPRVEPASVDVPAWLDTPSYVDQQEYLEDSPIGVDAYAAWTYQGGKGENVHFIDVELCWNWSHEDLPDPFFTSGTPDVSYIDHGTAVMGEVAGIENDYGITGIAPQTAVGGVAIDIDDYPANVAGWFDIASAALDPGDAWLIELHAPGPDGNYVCMEWWQANYDAIANSTAMGRICIEAGGNGSADLDNPIYAGKFDRNIRDSLAILVGAGTPYAMAPEWFTNYGSRMDANGWGSEIVTTGYGDLYTGTGINQWYTADFGGTSGASPMVTGVVCAAQSIYKELTGGETLDPETLRSAITETGAPQPSPVTQYIGPRPDLEALLQHEVFDVIGLRFDRSLYHCSSIVTVTLRHDSPPDPVTATVTSAADPAGETVWLTEVATGKYQASVALTDLPPAPGDGMVSVADGDTITGVYAPLGSTDTADIDCQAPSISDVHVDSVTFETAVIQWTTSEPADSSVFFGSSIPDQVVTDDHFDVNHTLLLDDLDQCQPYVFYVVSTDVAGNSALDNNGGAYYSFTTYEVFFFLNEPMDSDPGWVISGGQWAFGQPMGLGGEHGSPDPSSGHTGSKVYGYNLHGDYAANIPEYHLTAGPMDLSQAEGTQLSFWRWLGVEQPAYDHAYVRISTNSSAWTTIWQNPVEVADSSWQYCQYDISDWVDGHSNVWIRWTMGAADYAWQYCGWNIDDVEVFSSRPCESTPAPTHTPDTTSTATATPVPSTPTRTPTATTTLPPAPPTETPTASPVPESTDTPTPPSQTSTATPVPVTQTPTPVCTDFGVSLEMPSHYFHPQDSCYLNASLCNPLEPVDSTLLFVALEFEGQFWFYPGWRSLEEGIDFQIIAPLQTGIQTITVIEEFTWPETGTTMEGLKFHGVLTDPQISIVLGTYSMWEFGFSD